MTVNLRLLAPVAVDFHIVSGADLRDPTGHAQFWKNAQGRLKNIAKRQTVNGSAPACVLTRVQEGSSLNLYRTIDGDSSDRPLHVLEARWEPASLAPLLAKHPLWPNVTCVDLRLYDHGIAVVEVAVSLDSFIDAEISVGTTHEQVLDKVQANAVSLGEIIATTIVDTYLSPWLAALRALDHQAEHIRATGLADRLGEATGVLWVSRSLFVSHEPSPNRDSLLRHWLKDVTVESDETSPAELLINGASKRCIRWLNYAFIDMDDGQPGLLSRGSEHFSAWEALRYAQVFYAALDRIDALLSRVLADSAVAQSTWELGKLKESLTMLSQDAEFVIMERQRLSKFLSRPIRTAMDSILDFWDHEELVETPVRFKIVMCDRRLAEMAARRGARSALFTDLILLGIGVTSILGTALAVTEFGRSVTNDATTSGYDLGRSSAIEWFAAQPADAILIASGVVSALLVAVFLFFRRTD